MATVTGTSTTVGVASSGTLLAVKAPTLGAGGGWTQGGGAAAVYGVKAGTAGATVVGADTVVTVAGKTVPVTVTGQLTKADIAGAVVGCATGGFIGCALSVGVPLATAYFSLSGARINPDTKILEATPPGCYSAPCYNFRVNTGGFDSGNKYSADLACSAWGALYRTTSGADVYTVQYINVTSEGASSANCRYNLLKNGGAYVNNWDQTATKLSTAPASPTWNPTTSQAVKDALIANPAVPPIGIVPELHNNGVDWTGKLSSPAISGPADVKGPKTTTIAKDGSKVVSQEATPLTYAGPKVTAGPTVKTDTATKADGTPDGSATTTTEPGTEGDKPAEEKPEDKAECEKSPDTLGCSKLDVPEQELPKETKTITFAAEDHFGGGSCPANKMWTVQTTGQTITGIDWGVVCGWAVPLRGLVMALASLVALLIVMPGGRQEL